MTTDHGSPDSSKDGAGNSFAAELRRWRDVRGLSRAALAKRMGYDRSYVSKVESGAERPSREFATHAETALRAGGALRQAFRDHTATDHRGNLRRPEPEVLPMATAGTGSLVVAHDDATLTYHDGLYRLTQRRRLVNEGTEPVTRYLIRISVDRFPGDPERSNQLYAENPLTWEEIGLRAWYGQGRAESMDWVIHHDRAAFKEVWLLLSTRVGRFPLYPGQSCWIEYEYTVRDEHWGHWFQRAVRLPTRKLSVRLDFPADLRPSVWGLMTSMTAEGMPFPTPIEYIDEGERRVFAWSTSDPPLHARYRLEWNFRGGTTDSGSERLRPSETMRRLGVVQEDDPRLRRVAELFDLPTEAEDARRVASELSSAAERVGRVHVFGKGMGIAAPQLGIDRAAALVRPPDGGPAITLFNPRVIEAGPETDEQYEGCLSFFDVRGQVRRPLSIQVEHTDVSGARHLTVFERGMARLVAHEIDHLNGVLYTDRMPQGIEPIPVERYRGTGHAWRY